MDHQLQQTGAESTSGAGFARQALRQAQLAAQKHGGRLPTQRPHRRAAGRTGRDPAGFGAVLRGLLAERAWELPAAGGSILGRWPQIAATVSPQLAAHVAAVAYQAEARRLDLRPDSPAYATQVRLTARQIIAAANQLAGADAVRDLLVLPPGGVASGAAPPGGAASPPSPPASAPVRTREMASTGYRRALAAHRAAKPPANPMDNSVAAAAERQERALREQRRRRSSEHFDDNAAAVEARRAGDSVQAAAVRRARAERAERRA